MRCCCKGYPFFLGNEQADIESLSLRESSSRSADRLLWGALLAAGFQKPEAAMIGYDVIHSRYSHWLRAVMVSMIDKICGPNATIFVLGLDLVRGLFLFRANY
jgi:hypothetical protein